MNVLQKCLRKTFLGCLFDKLDVVSHSFSMIVYLLYGANINHNYFYGEEK